MGIFGTRILRRGKLAAAPAFLRPIIGTLLEAGMGPRGLGAVLIMWTRRKRKPPSISKSFHWRDWGAALRAWPLTRWRTSSTA